MYNIYKTFLFTIYEPLRTIFTFSHKHFHKNIFTKTFFAYKFLQKHFLLTSLLQKHVCNKTCFSEKQIYKTNSQIPRFSCNIGFIFSSFYNHKVRNPGVLGSSRTGSSGFFRGSVLGQDTSEPQPSTGETQERHE